MGFERNIHEPVSRKADSLEALLRPDAWRMKVLAAVAGLNLPDWYVAAGFVRNMVWDHLHGYPPSALNDVDVVYFDKAGTHAKSPEQIRTALATVLPDVNWEVKNQACMHMRNGDPPYRSTADAMGFWPEKETAVGVRLTLAGSLEVAAPFGLGSLLAGCITHNPRRLKSVFLERLERKKWLAKWPRLRVVW